MPSADPLVFRRVCGWVFCKRFIINALRVTCQRTPLGRLINKNAPHGCEAFGAENETRTASCNMLIIGYLCQRNTTSGETWVKLLWPFETYLGCDLSGHLYLLRRHLRTSNASHFHNESAQIRLKIGDLRLKSLEIEPYGKYI